ncbi:hypothetical protein roselon_01386 [Roseibacterium elongatum DSM 19469]|uniref:Uncharacterized protein n=1 Tax=Roseicyclus elongatus DSM 19469 TaxID=1294273 RepID=W8RRP8_9RHOB|nr:hypothetical protein [Roseibacterium elongatum]AHM03773.1 hypothetical protein roselon_01386 [Roseibacterium elongatum DSM 19469]
MFTIFANSFMTASRQKDWGAPDPHPIPERRVRHKPRTERRELNGPRRWL